MPAEPAVKRAIAFFDGQNLFYATKYAFGYSWPNSLTIRSSLRPDSLQNCLPEAFRKYLPSFFSDMFHAGLELCPPGWSTILHLSFRRLIWRCCWSF